MTSQQQNTTVNQEKRQNGHSTQKYERRNQQNRKHFTKQRKFVPREKQNYRNGGQRHTNESRTIYIGKIFNRDLEGFVFILFSSYSIEEHQFQINLLSNALIL